jgi:phosphoserine aminotransferase
MPEPDIVIPPELRPSDGRFGSGPSKIRPEAVGALHRAAPGYLGTSHRQHTVRSTVGRLRVGLHDLFGLPDGYEVVLGIGGTTVLWDAMVFSFINRLSRHFVFGEFSSKFAQAVTLAPHLEAPEVVESEPGTHPELDLSESCDLYALTHNETSTGVAMAVERPSGRGLVAVDATSAAGGLRVDAKDFDFYYFAPQKCFASDGGLWLALASPAAIERIESIAARDRYVPPSIDLMIALENSRKDQTYNTPGLATLFLMVEQIDWMLDSGGLAWAAARCDRSADIIYSWADGHELVAPFVKDPGRRSHVVAALDFDARVDAAAIAKVLRSNGILDTEPYRKLGRNQLRVALYPAIEPGDVEALTRCVDYVLEMLVD